MRSVKVVTLVFALLQFSNNCQADLIVEFDSVSMLSGTSGNNRTSSIDVYVRNRAGSVEIGQFSLLFQVSTPRGSDGVLRFLDPQNNLERIEADYVLAKAPLGTFRSAVQDDPRQLIQSDNVLDSLAFPAAGQTVTIDTTRKLLARLELEHLSASAVDAEFTVTLRQTTNSTFFQRYEAGNFLPTLVNIAAESYTNTGSIGISAVPEPNSFLLAGVSCAFFALRRNRREFRR